MKTQMQLANRAWRTETRSLGWKHGRKAWKDFCRANAKVMVIESDGQFDSQAAANDAVREELSCWGE